VEAFVSSENFILDALEKYYQIPRAVRPTIPLADQAEEEAETVSPVPRPVPGPPPARPPTSVSGREELGLDGRPLSASAEGMEETRAVPSLQETGPGASPSAPLPRSIEEWRSQEEAPMEAPAPPSIPPASAEGVSGPGDPGRRPTLTHPAARTALTLVPTPPPASVEEVAARLRDSLSRDEVFDALVGFLAARFVRAALFVVMQEKVIGWGGRGDGFDPGRIRSTTIPFSAPSIFSYFRMGSDFYFGPVPDLPANRQIYGELGVPAPDRVLLVPIQIKGRLIALLYGDNGIGRREEPDIGLYRRVAQKASLALEILILRNKIEMI